MSKGYIENSIMLSKSLIKLGGGERGLFYYTTDAASLVKGVKSCWDIRGNYATKSTVAECVKRLCLDCVAELLAAFLESPGLTGRRGSVGVIDSTHTRYLA